MLALDVHHFNKHVWDVEWPFYIVQRKYVLAVETTFCVASGLIKVSILLFYKRLGSHAVSKSFQWTTKATIAFITAYSIAFTLVPIFGCQPFSAFWDQLDIIKIAKGYKYKCFNEGADVFSAAVISTVQDLITAVLPTFIYWKLQMPARQKVALFIIFAFGYSVVAIGVLRSYFTWQVFFETYDATWAVWDCLISALLEIYIGAICANIPAFKVFFQVIFRINTSSTGSRSNKYIPGTKSSTNRRTGSSFSTSSFSKRSLRKARDYGRISELSSDLMVTSDDGTTQLEEIVAPAQISRQDSMDTRSGMTDDIEMGILPTRCHPEARQSKRDISPSQEGAQALPQMPSPYPAAQLRQPTRPKTFSSMQELKSKPAWQNWT